MAVLVSVGTDGVTNWVKLPDGQRLNLGAISPLQLVRKLAKGSERAVLDAFLQDGEALVSVDEDRLWALLTPPRPRWASGGLFMPVERQTLARKIMPTIDTDLTALERHISALNKAAAARTAPAKMAEGHQILVRLATKIKSPNQSKNDTYYGLGTEAPFEVGDAAPKPVTVNAGIEGLAIDTIEANQQTAQLILVQAEEAVAKIDRLASAGRRFNAAQAKADIHAVTSKVANILKQDLSASWVGADLQKLAARSAQLHGLFAQAKV